MRKFLPLIIGIVLMTVSPGFSQEPKGRIEFEKTVHDFGEIDKGTSVTTKFTFKNKGKGVLRIKDVVASCGCTSAKPEKIIYQPGEAGEISVTFDSARFNGNITKKVTVHTDNLKNSQTALTITGQVVSEILSKPEHLFFADARMGKVSTQEIMVTTTRLPKLEISNIKTNPEFLSAELKRIDDQAIAIKVTADGTKYPEEQVRLKGAIQFETNATTQPIVRSTVTVNIVSPIGVHPRYAMFWASPLGQTRNLDIRLVANDETAFSIESLEASLDFIEVKKISDTADERSIKITLKPDAPEGSFKGKITIKTTHPGQKKIVIPMRGSVIKTS